MLRLLTPRNPSRRAGARRAAALAAAALLAVGGVAGGCGGSDDDAAPPPPATSTSPDLGGPDLTDADQRVVSVLLGFVRVAGEQGDLLVDCADDACRDRLAATLQEAGDGVDAALDEGGEPSDCFAGVADSLRSAAEAARDGGDDALEQVRAELGEASSAAGAC